MVGMLLCNLVMRLALDYLTEISWWINLLIQLLNGLIHVCCL